MKKIDRLLIQARKKFGSSGIIIAFIEKLSENQWGIKGFMRNGTMAYNQNELTTKGQTEECLEALLDKHNSESLEPCIIFTGEEELED